MHPLLKLLKVFVITPWERQQREEGRHIKGVTSERKRIPAYLQLLRILSDMLYRYLREDARAFFCCRPKAMLATALFEHLACRAVCADESSLAYLFLDELLRLLFLSIYK